MRPLTVSVIDTMSRSPSVWNRIHVFSEARTTFLLTDRKIT